MRTLYSFIGGLAGASINIIYNLIASAIQRILFKDQFSQQSLLWLIGFALAGILIGAWLGKYISIPSENPTSTSSQSQKPSNTPSQLQTVGYVRITRLRAFITYIKTRGRDISLNDIIVFGSRIDIDTRE